MECGFVIDRDLLARLDIAQRDEKNVIVENLHVRVGHTRVVDVVSAVAATAAVETPTPVDFTNPQHLAMRSPPCFGV